MIKVDEVIKALETISQFCGEHTKDNDCEDCPLYSEGEQCCELWYIDASPVEWETRKETIEKVRI